MAARVVRRQYYVSLIECGSCLVGCVSVPDGVAFCLTLLWADHAYHETMGFWIHVWMKCA